MGLLDLFNYIFIFYYTAHASLFKERTCRDCDFRTKVQSVLDRHVQQNHPTKQSEKRRAACNNMLFAESYIYRETDVARFSRREVSLESSLESI